MYAQQFGLEKAVFSAGIAQHDDLFLSPRLQRIAANLKIGLTTRDSIVTLTGFLGVGKTTIAAHALSITATRLAQTWLGNTQLAPDEMLESLLAGFELAPYDMGRVQRLHTWRQFMGEMSATDTRVCILVENALGLGPAGLHALEALTAADPNDCPGANLILMGPAQLQQLLEQPGLARLKQRIRSRQRLDPMTPQEVEQYLRHCLSLAGGDYDTIFAPGTAAIVHSYSAGVPRMIKNVCETALIVAGTRKATQVTPEIVQRVAEGVYGLAPSVKLPEAPVATAPTAALVAAVTQPAEQPLPPTVPAPVNAAAPAAAPVATVEQPPKEAVPPAAPTPIDADAPVDPKETETLVDPAISGTTDSAEQAAEPPILTEAAIVNTDAEPQPTVTASSTTDGAQDSPWPPVLTDEVDIDLPGDTQKVAADSQPVAATLPPDAPPLPDEALQADPDFTEDFASATHLHEISDEMAELLFSDYREATSASPSESAGPLDSSDLDLTPDGTAVVRQLDENDLPDESEENEPARATTLVF